MTSKSIFINNRPRGPMDKASVYGTGDSRFESWRGHFPLFLGQFNFLRKWIRKWMRDNLQYDKVNKDTLLNEQVFEIPTSMFEHVNKGEEIELGPGDLPKDIKLSPEDLLKEEL